MQHANGDAGSRLIRAGLLTGVIDALFSSVLSSVFYGSTVTRLWLGVASALLGPKALEGGTGTALFGLLMHFTVAFTWSAVLLFVLLRLDFIRSLLYSRFGPIKVATLYGPFIWLVMSLCVVPVLLHRPPNITYRWWIQFFGHIPFVALPMAAMIKGKNPVGGRTN